MTAEKVKLYVRDDKARKYHELEGWEGIFNDEVGSVVSVVTDAYTLIPNDEVGKLVDPILQDEGFHLQREIDIGGRRHFWEYKFGSPFEPVKGDEYELFVLVKNSYDRSSALRFTGGFYRVICSNGLIIGTGMTARIVHAGKGLSLDKSFKARFKAFVNVTTSGLDTVKVLAAVPGLLPLQDFWDLLKDLAPKLPKKYYPKVPDGEEIDDVKGTPYDLVNEVTRAISHDDRVGAEKAIERRNYLLQQTSHVIPALVSR